ncbi:MAG: ATP-binding cassette domain-containing protein [Desulfobacterales bacterium]|jgi:branched-chain amino acid transport system ATP-binding protein|nr:ATP-binding cassette domain-containing protein [Desulfobacterales bacterium]MDP6808491.1 ATP-binding cassette domain-containing protein [Desulfobacterales bacterium]|tara:strand:+ start:27186 stop:27944 length:759 start_codon:yes stop_codon:yes gene_type:complete
MALLEVRKMTKFFSGLTAVMELTMDVHSKQIFGLIGPNGAGKSTALNMIGGTLLPSQGQVIFDGEKITKLPSHRRTQRGIARVFQENLLFSSFTVLENVLVGCQLQRKIGLSSIFLNTGSNRTQEEARQRRAFNTLKFVGLAQYANELAINLPHGRQRLLALAIALATQPELLLLDEPLTGMNVEEIETMLAMITALREQKGITCIIIEHNLRAVMGLCDRIAVLNFGKKIAEGAPGEIVENQAVMEAYLGT